MSILIFILILSFLVIIHELGHYLAAKWAKVKVDEFGIGYPPKLLKLFKFKETVFSINLIPFGGFVRMQGEEGPDEDQKKAKKNGQFYQASAFRKLVIILAGASVNFLFGVIAFTIVFSKMGIPETISDARIGEVSQDSPAQEAGIKEDINVIGLQIDDQERISISTAQELIENLEDQKGKSVTIFTTGLCNGLECDLSESNYSVYLRTEDETPSDQGSMGITFSSTVFVFYPSWEMPIRSVIFGFQQAFYLAGQIVQAFVGIITGIFTQGKISGDVAGPVGIIHQAQTIGIFEDGFLTILSFAGMLSINLAIMNVLPFPPLDGGRALFIILELIFKKKRTEKIEYFMNYGGYIFLLGLIVVITAKDFWRIFVN